jgi:hypothetical protein
MAQLTPEEARDLMIICSKQECIDKIDRFVKAGVPTSSLFRPGRW